MHLCIYKYHCSVVLSSTSSAGKLSPDVQSSREQLRELKFQQYEVRGQLYCTYIWHGIQSIKSLFFPIPFQYGQKQYYVQILQEILMARQVRMSVVI